MSARNVRGAQRPTNLKRLSNGSVYLTTTKFSSFFEHLKCFYFRSQEELADDIPEAIAEEPAQSHTVPPSPAPLLDTADSDSRCLSHASYFKQVSKMFDIYKKINITGDF